METLFDRNDGPSIFELPIFVYLPRKTMDDKKSMLNMNVYRNQKHFVSNQVKQLFRPVEIPNDFKAFRIEISYRVEKTTNRKYDTMNIISIVDKFFLDWLVSNGFLPDDTCKNVQYGKIIGYNGCSKDRVIAEIMIKE